LLRLRRSLKDERPAARQSDHFLIAIVARAKDLRPISIATDEQKGNAKGSY